MVKALIRYLSEKWNNLSDEIKLVLGVVSGIILIHLIFWFFSPKSPEPITDSREIPKAEKVIINNIEYAKTLEKQITIKDKLIDSMAKALKVKPKQIKGVDRIIIQVDTLLTTKTVFLPSEDSSVISYKDSWVDIKAVGKKEGSSYVNFRLTPDTTSLIRVEKKPLFKQPYTEVYVKHSNPYFNTSGASSLVIKEPKVLFSIGLVGGYDPFQNKAFIGIGIQPEAAKIRIYKRNR